MFYLDVYCTFLINIFTGGDDADISSPIHRSEIKFHESNTKAESVESNKRNVPLKSPGTGLRKLAHLAEAINQWEDEIHSVS